MQPTTSNVQNANRNLQPEQVTTLLKNVLADVLKSLGMNEKKAVAFAADCYPEIHKHLRNEYMSHISFIKAIRELVVTEEYVHLQIPKILEDDQHPDAQLMLASATACMVGTKHHWLSLKLAKAFSDLVIANRPQ